MSTPDVTPDSNERNASPVTPRNAMPLSNAERQRLWRQRKKLQAQSISGSSARTTRTSTSTAKPITHQKGKAAKEAAKATYKPSQSKDTANDATPTLEQPETNGGAHQDSREAKPVERDERGRFLVGHSAGGRPLGSRNKLTEDFIEDFHDMWLESGPAALRHMVKNDPSAFVRAAVQLMPKDVLVEARGAVLAVVETPVALKALLEALPDLGVLPLTGPVIGKVIDVEVEEVPVAPLKPEDGEQ